MDSHTATALAETAVIQAIRKLLAQHGRGVDRADAGTIAQCYHDDAEVDYGFFTGPASELATILAAAQTGGPITLHRVAQSWIRLTGEDEALGESYVTAYAQSPADDGSPRQRLICGRYLDRFTRREGAWKIAHRRYVLDVPLNHEGSFAPPPLGDFANHFPTGGHGRADPGLALLARGRAAAFSSRKEKSAMNAPSADLIDQTISTQQLATLTAAYCRGVDRTDEALLKSLFHEDSVVTSGAFNGNGQDFAVEICKIVRDYFEMAFHSTANQWFEIDGDEAVGESYAIAATTPRGEDEPRMGMLTGGRYIDRFSRRNGVWKFAERHFVCDWTLQQPAPRQEDGMIAALPLRGAQGPEDPIYRFWK